MTDPGWYGDPAGSGGRRWWDGAQWTEHMRDAPTRTHAPSFTPKSESLELNETSIAGHPKRRRKSGVIIAASVVGLGLIGAAAFAGLVPGGSTSSASVDLSAWGSPITVEEYASTLPAADFPTNANDCETAFEEWSKKSVLVMFSEDLEYDSSTADALSNHVAAMNAAFADCVANRAIDLDDLEQQQDALMELLK